MNSLKRKNLIECAAIAALQGILSNAFHNPDALDETDVASAALNFALAVVNRIEEHENAND